MKKLTHTLALSTILLGALSPTGQAIADTVPTQDVTQTTSQTSAQAASSHVDPNIDWTNWQNNPNVTAVPSLHFTGRTDAGSKITHFEGSGIIPEPTITSQGDTVPTQSFNGYEFGRDRGNAITGSYTVALGFKNVLTDESLEMSRVDGANNSATFQNFVSKFSTPIRPGTEISASGTIGGQREIRLIDVDDQIKTLESILIPQTVKVYYKDAQTGEDLSSSDILGLGGVDGQEVSGTAKSISGYNLQSNSLVTPDSVVDGSGETVATQMKSSSSVDSYEGQQAIVFWYDKAAVPAEPVTLHYVDQDGAQIDGQKDVTLTGFNEGDTIPFSDNTPTIPGYTLDTTNQPDPTLTFTNTAQTFNIPYTRNQGTAVNVRYVDGKGQKIAESAQITGFENETKPTDPYKIDIPGYTLDESKLPVSEVTLSTAAQDDVVFTYKQNPGSITLKYEDEQGQALAESQTLEEDVTTPFTAEDYKLDIPGYYLTSLPTNVTQFTSDPQTAIYKYAVDQTALEAHDKLLYVGDSWSAEATFDSITSEDGTKTTVLPSDVVVEGQVDTSKVGDYTVTYTWTNPHTNKRVSKSIVVHVVDKSAILVHDSTLTVGDTWTAQDNFDSALNKKGDKVPFDQIKVDGAVDTSKAGTYKVTYTYDETNSPQVMKAEVGASHQGTTTVTATITVKDKAPVAPGNPDNPGEPTTPTTPGQPDQPNGSDNTSTNTSGNTTVNVSSTGENSKASNKTLPDTGEENNVSLIASGLGMLLALMGLILFREAKQKKGQ